MSYAFEDSRSLHPLVTCLTFGCFFVMQKVELAWEHTDRADLAIVMGSSLKVGPACDMPVKVAKNGGKLVIINLQRTPFDGRAALVLIQLFLFLFVSELLFLCEIVVNLWY